MQVGVLLFEEFETLDVFGPVEIFGRLNEHYEIRFYSMKGGLVSNSHGVSIQTETLENINSALGIFLIPGGYGTRSEVDNEILIDQIKTISENSSFVLTVCTGSALLARTGLLDHRSATSNKRAFDWVTSQGTSVKWIRKARWTVDGKYYTSSGVSAGMDMTLGFLKERHGYEFSKQVAKEIEYNWQEEKDLDPFA